MAYIKFGDRYTIHQTANCQIFWLYDISKLILEGQFFSLWTLTLIILSGFELFQPNDPPHKSLYQQINC